MIQTIETRYLIGAAAEIADAKCASFVQRFFAECGYTGHRLHVDGAEVKPMVTDGNHVYGYEVRIPTTIKPDRPAESPLVAIEGVSIIYVQYPHSSFQWDGDRPWDGNTVKSNVGGAK